MVFLIGPRLTASSSTICCYLGADTHHHEPSFILYLHPVHSASIISKREPDGRIVLLNLYRESAALKRASQSSLFRSRPFIEASICTISLRPKMSFLLNSLPYRDPCFPSAWIFLDECSGFTNLAASHQTIVLLQVPADLHR